MEIRSPLIHLALLESLKANEISDEIDLFLPFIAVTLSEISGEEVKPNLLQDSFAQCFGIKPPISAIEVFMTRAKKRKLLVKENHAFFSNHEQVEKWKNGYYDKKEDIEVSQQVIREDLKFFAKFEFDKELENDDCDILITEFIEKNISSVASQNRFEKSHIKSKIKNTDYVIASFVSHIHKEKKSTLDHFSRIVKGMVLANYLCYADKVGNKKQYHSITVYLDTPIILGLLGYSGKQKRKSTCEFISLLNKVGIALKFFDKSLDEAERLLTAWRDDLKRKKYGRFNSKTLELLQAQGYDAVRLDTEIKLLKSRIESEGISVVTGFKLNPAYQCDETALELAISANFKEHKNLTHDTICISRIHNLRENRLISDLNQEMSVFVTSNTGLVTHANNFFSNEIPRRYIPLVVSEQWMTTMFWLKSPDVFSSLPMDQLVASAYGLLYTDDRFWNAFIAKLQYLERDGKISEEEFTFVRWDSELLHLIHDVSVDVGEDFSDEDVFDIVESIKQRHIQDKDNEINEIKTSAEIEKKELQDGISKKSYQIDRTSARLNKISKFIGSSLAVLLCSVVFVCVFLASYNSLPEEIIGAPVAQDMRNGILFLVATVVSIFIGFAGFLWGWSLISIYGFVKNRATISIYKLLAGE